MTGLMLQNKYDLCWQWPITTQVIYSKSNLELLKHKFTFLFSDEVLDDDIRHAVPVSIAILVEAVNRTENKLVAGDGPILAAQHLGKR